MIQLRETFSVSTWTGFRILKDEVLSEVYLKKVSG